MPHFTVTPPCMGFSCEHGRASPDENGVFEIESGAVIAAMRAHGLTLTEVPAPEAKKKQPAKTSEPPPKRAPQPTKAADPTPQQPADPPAQNDQPPPGGDAAALEAAMRAALAGADTASGA